MSTTTIEYTAMISGGGGASVMNITFEVTINGTTYTARIPHEAVRSAECAGVDVAADIRRLATGEVTTEALLAECLDGCEPEHEGDWRDYVEALSVAVSA